jgi:hypothetical protein
MTQHRLLFESSAVCRGYLIIPFQTQTLGGSPLFSYCLLSEAGKQGAYHQAKNPAGLYSGSVDGILKIAREHLETFSDSSRRGNYFKRRYVYLNNLIIISQAGGRYFYDHYPPYDLKNIAAPKLFPSEHACIHWIKQGLDCIRAKATYAPV